MNHARKITRTRGGWLPRWKGNRLTPDRLMAGRAGKVFDTKRECKAFIDETWGYIKTRPDLRRAPHFWRLPKPVRVRVVVTTL